MRRLSRDGIGRFAAFAVVCIGLKAAFAALPDSVVMPLFCRVPAEIAAFYYGVPLDVATLSFTAKDVTLAVARACAATDFFALVASVMVLRSPWHILSAWAVTLAVNSLRVIALVPMEALFPRERLPVFHLMTGVAFFLPVFALIWYNFRPKSPFTKQKEEVAQHER